MPITTRASGKVTIVDFGDYLTARDGVVEFREAMRGLIEDGHTQIVLNCDAFIDETGIGEIVKAYTAAVRHGGTIKITLGNRIGFPGLLPTAKLLTVFETFHTEAEAIASFNGDRA